MSTQRIIILLVLVVIVVSGIVYLNSQKVERNTAEGVITITPRISNEVLPLENETVSGSVTTNTPPAPKAPTPVVTLPATQKFLSTKEKSNKYELAKEITTPDGFINTDGKPVTISEFIGKKVVLIDFWTYSCINCQRTTPYLNAWYEKYKDKGFVIIGIHTPEFEFEKVYQNVLEATKKEGINYPVVLDNDFSTWNAYKNRFWPRKYLIDIDGYVVYDRIGEGAYEETEQKIQEALAERMIVLGESGTINQSITKEIFIQSGPRSPETYFGSARNEFFGNSLPGVAGSLKDLIVPTQPTLNTLYLSGDWNITKEFAENNSSNAGIVFKYNSKNVFLVAESNEESTVEILLDGKPLITEAGADVVKTTDGKTVVKIKEARLYKIIQGKQSEIRTLEFKILKPGLKAFAFTFG